MSLYNIRQLNLDILNQNFSFSSCYLLFGLPVTQLLHTFTYKFTLQTKQDRKEGDQCMEIIVVWIWSLKVYSKNAMGKVAQRTWTSLR